MKILHGFWYVCGVPFRFLKGIVEGGNLALMLVLDYKTPLLERVEKVKASLYIGMAPRHVLSGRWLGVGIAFFFGGVGSAVGILFTAKPEEQPAVAVTSD